VGCQSDLAYIQHSCDDVMQFIMLRPVGLHLQLLTYCQMMSFTEGAGWEVKGDLTYLQT